MREATARHFARRIYRQHHGAEIAPNYLNWRSIAGADGKPRAVLGYRSAGDGPLFLERYLDHPVEDAVSTSVGTQIGRDRIVEIGCLAAVPSGALIKLWELTAVALSGSFDVAVATLTAPLRTQFRRVGLPLVELVPAESSRSGASGAAWGSYYSSDPKICIGWIADGADALSAYAARRGRRP